MKSQIEFTKDMMFNYFALSSVRENEVFSKYPFYLSEELFNDMVISAETLNRIVLKIIKRLKQNREIFKTGKFKFKDDILDQECSVENFFWSRFDTFCRADGGIFFSEFNYDKPCAQREIIFSSDFGDKENKSKLFKEKFLNGFVKIWRNYCLKNKEKQKLNKPKIAYLVDPSHYDEVHLGYIHKDILKSSFDLIIAGADNFSVVDDEVYVFDEKIDIILKQYPTEFLTEVNDNEKIIELYKMGKILFINDLNSIFAQVKSLFAYLWELVENNDNILDESEREIIIKTIPKTKLFNKSQISEIIKNKNKIVLKPIYGRYSIDVFIGAMETVEDWIEIVKYVESENIESEFIVQEFIEIKKDNVLKYKDFGYREEIAFGNFGIYLTNGNFAGICVRWSDNYLSSDEVLWVTPVNINKTTDLYIHEYLNKIKEDINVEEIKIENFNEKLNRNINFENKELFYYSNIDKYKKINIIGRKIKDDVWNKINYDAMFNYQFTGGYTQSKRSFLLDLFCLKADKFEELEIITNEISKIFKKTLKYIVNNFEYFYSLLDIDERLKKVIINKIPEELTFIGRFDFLIDQNSNFKLIEFNSETPAGFMESLVLQNLIIEEVDKEKIFQNPNKEMMSKIIEVFEKYIFNISTKCFNSEKSIDSFEIKNIAFVCTTYNEDWYNTKLLFEKIKSTKYNFIFDTVDSICVKDKKIYLGDIPIDLMYRYYPLDWFLESEEIITALENNTISINSPSTFITQSKVFFCIIYELIGKNFYDEKEEFIIQKYIAKSYLDYKKFSGNDFLIKNIWGREGDGIFHSYSGVLPNDIDKYMFQEKIDIKKYDLNIDYTYQNVVEGLYPVIGTYVIGDNFGGVYSRFDGRVTQKSAVFLPTVII